MSDTIRYLVHTVTAVTPGDSGPEKLAYRHVSGKAIASKTIEQNNLSSGILYCGGFNSKMDGIKATHLHRECEKAGIPFTRFDYSGHGASDGRFVDGTIGGWLADARLVLDSVCIGPQVIVGSSMGAWIAMLLARQQPQRIHGLVLIAPAPDFTRYLNLPPEARIALDRDGVWYRPWEYSDDPYPITQRLIEEAADHQILSGPPLDVAGPVHILHGDGDDVIPVAHAQRVRPISMRRLSP